MGWSEPTGRLPPRPVLSRLALGFGSRRPGIDPDFDIIPSLSIDPERFMSDLEIAKAKTTDTYNSASDYFDHPSNTFWDRFGQITIDRLNLQPGQTVLDVCCGSGASAIPAAEYIVGPAK